jgi:hypothetical protein
MNTLTFVTLKRKSCIRYKCGDLQTSKYSFDDCCLLSIKSVFS